MSSEAPKARSFADILQQNQEFIAHLQTLQDDIASQLEVKGQELATVQKQMDAKQAELDELQNAQLQWAMDRQALLDEHASVKQGHKDLQDRHQRAEAELHQARDQWAAERQTLLERHASLEQAHQDLQQSHDRVRVELGRLQDDVTRARTRDEERRGQLRQLEQERMGLSQKYEAEQKKIAAELKTVQGDLDSLQTAQLQWAMDRESLLKDRDAAVARQAKLEQEWQAARIALTAERAALAEANGKLEQQLKSAQAEMEPLKAARDKWQAERQRLIGDVARLEQEGQAAEGQFKADRKLLQTQLDEARKKAADLDKAEAEFQRVSDERSALLTKVKALEKDWQVRETSIAEEKAALKKQVQDVNAKLAATQQDYEKVKALHDDLAGESGRKAEEWTVREQRLTSEKNQLKVDLERVQGQLSEMMTQTNELQSRRANESKELELAWQREKASLKSQLEEARKTAGTGPPSSQVIARYETEKRAMQAQLDGLRTELASLGKNKDTAPGLLQAKRDFEAKFRVIYDQSHDLNSPLNAIIGFSEILLDEKGNKTTPEERREFVAHINESGKRLVEHIRELIEFAKQESGIQERPVQMLPPVGVSTKAPVILVADNDPSVKERIEPFLSHAGYEVVIAASAQEALRKAVQLQPLAVLIDTQLPPNGGSGLVYDLRRESKTKDIPIVLTSKVNKESLPFDIGQADFLTKPIDRQQLLQMMVKFDLLADGKRGKKTPSSILIVDDDPQNIRLIKAMLKPFNMEVMIADGGKAGLEIAMKKKPDLIILDLMMPDVDGFEVVSKLREDPAAAQIPILIYTAKNITSEDRERLQGNIQTIIQKGDFGKDRFLEMINNLQIAQAS
ncbi:MAG: response regulator [Candidatus Dormibacteraeota bacterium]|nr:response regulator [Candidatus Dormibacteraeota bacterium]